MGAINSLIDTPGGYSILQRNSETWHCRFCGSAYNDICAKDMIHTSGLENHHPAELCGIWLGKSHLNQTRDIRLNDFRAISTSPVHCVENECNFESTGSPLITLPKRSCAPAKSHVATLLRHADATKNHSTSKEEFFSTMDIRNSSSAQYTELEGCRINGCLFVEHGNLVFQAISKRSRIPFLLIDQQMLGPTSDCISSAFSSFKGGLPDNPKTQNSIQNSSLICSSTENSTHLINLDKSGQKCLIPHMDNPYTSTNRCSEDSKPRHPPPPLRLSWPLVTLRRFGFYGNSLFKVETGRRAPRGEGIYLFRIKHLREFRKSFETCVHHRRDNLSVHQLSTTTSESRPLLRNNNSNSNTGKISFIMPFNKIFHKHSSTSLLSTTHILRGSIINGKSDQTLLNEQRETLRHHSRQHAPVLSERNNLAFSFDDAEIDLFQGQNVDSTTNKKNKIKQQKQEYQDQVSLNCLHWLQLQSSPDCYSNENSHQRVNNRCNYNHKHSSTKLQHNFKLSCPQLNDITSINPINWNNNNNNNRNDAKPICNDSQRHHVGGGCRGYCLRGDGSYHRPNRYRSYCLDEDTDDDKIVDFDECTVEEEEISNLPEAPLPPICNNSSYCDIIQDGQDDYQKIYDNLIVVNNGVNNNNDSNNDDCFCNNTLVRQSLPSMTEIGNTEPAHCCIHQQVTSQSLSKNDERTERIHNALNCIDEIDKKKPTDRQSHVSSIDGGVVKSDVAISSVGEQQNNVCQNSPTLLKQSLSSDMNLNETFDKSNSITTSSTTSNDPKEHDMIKKCKNKSQTLILPRLPSISTSSKMYLHSRHASLPNPNTCASSSNTVSSCSGSISRRDNNAVDIDANHCRDENLSFRSHKKLSSDYLCKIHRNLSNSADRKNFDLLDMITEYSPYYNLLTNPETSTQLRCTGRCTSQTIAPSLLGEYNPKCTHSSSVSCLPNDFTTNCLPSSSANYSIVNDNINCTSCCSSYFKESPIQNSHNQSLVLSGSSSIMNAIISVTTNTTTFSSASMTTTSASSVPHSINNLGYHKHYERPTSMLHYATLDFGPVTLEACQYRNESYSDMNNVHRNNDMPNTLTGSSYTHRYCPVNNVTNASTTDNNGSSGACNQDNLTESCSSHIYGTLTDSLHVIESPCQNHFYRHNVSNNNSSHCDDMIHDETDTDLPSNYVAICQLQTLAMRAVLSATT